MDKYKWDLNKMFKNEKEFLNAIDEIESKLVQISNYKGKIYEKKDNLYSLLKLVNDASLLCEKVYVYSFLGFYDNTLDNKFQNYKQKAININNKFSIEASYIEPELLEKDFEYILNLMNDDKRLLKYKFYLEKIFRYKCHTLSKEEEKLLSIISDAFNVSIEAYTLLDNADVEFEDIIDDSGNSVKLTSSNYSRYITSKNENVRKSAFESMHNFYKKHINTISSLYIGNVKNNVNICKLRKYNNILDFALFSDNIEEKLYKNLIKIVDKNINLLQDYYSLKSKILGKKLHMYDTYLNISSSLDKKISYEQAIDIANEALKPLGKDYLREFNNIVNKNSIDVFPKDNKRSGAYEWNAYGCDPYVSLNYDNNVNSVSTFIHEMGHAMHSFYSCENQDYIYSRYSIFLAEIASTVNEILLSNYFINNAKDVSEKVYYLVQFLDNFKATVFRQVMFAEFEYNVHKKYENNEVLTKDLLCDEYYKLNLKHFSPALIVDEDIKYEWARIPHFFTSFYVYKYATGFISALVIANKLLNNEKDFKDKYIKFLSSGCSKYPLDLLKELGIDITSKDVMNDAFSIFNEKLKDLKNCLEKGV